ncbi:MAG: hypothetical protein K2L07_01740 [Lachnospiraceae bacterium]|nr:hypothetical protein [Lachnospiraceae bacterium]
MHNENVIYDGRRLAAYTIAADFCKTKGFDEIFLAELWEGILLNPVLYDEFVYFLQKNELTGNFICEGYSMFDLYFYHLGEYNYTHDVGKNPTGCDKDEIVFRAFHTMGRLVKDPVTCKKYLSQDLGMDFGI